MNKRERKSRLKDIVKTIDVAIVSIEKNAKNIIGQAQEKIEDLSWYLEENCIMPSDFDAEEMIKNILVDYFENDDEVQEIIGLIEELREEVSEHIEEMREGSNKEEWEDFYYNMEYIENVIDIEEQGIDSVDCFIDNMNQLKDDLENLI